MVDLWVLCFWEKKKSGELKRMQTPKAADLRVQKGEGGLAQGLADEPRRAGAEDVHFCAKPRHRGLTTASIS